MSSSRPPRTPNPTPGQVGADVIELPRHDAHGDPSDANDVDDVVDARLRAVARQGAHRHDEPVGAHLDAALLIAHLERRLDGPTRSRVIGHMASCALCCDRAQAAAEVLRVDAVPAPAGSSTHAALAEIIDIGPRLMQVTVAVAPASLRVVSSDAEVRVGLAAALRRGVEPVGVAFSRRAQVGGIDLELLDAAGGRVNLGVTVHDAPPRCRVSVLVGGRIVETRPLKRGQAILRGLPIRTVYLRLEAPGRVLGHIQLALTDGADAPAGGDHE